jgi:peptidoglycan-associated lipoprotein
VKKGTTITAILIMCFLIVFSYTLSAQGKYKDMGNKAYQSKQYIPAIEYYNKSLTKFDGEKSERNEILYKLADCYRIINDPKKAVIRYQQLIKYKYAIEKPEIYLYCANALSTLGRYSEALPLYQQYLAKMPTDLQAQAGIATCELCLRDTTTKSRWNIKIIKELNSSYDDFAAAYVDDKFTSVIFTSNRKGSTGNEKDNWTNGYFSDLYIANKQHDGTYSTPKLADTESEINTSANEGATCYDDKNQRLYFTRCDKMNNDKKFCRIMETEKSGNTWSKPTVVYADTLGNAGQPTLTSDGLTMIFASNRPDGKGGKDLWKTTRKSDHDSFDPAVNLGTMINTSGDEMFPSLFADSVLYFASNGRTGFGGLDIYCVSMGKSGISPVKHLPRPMNSPADDFAMNFEGNGEKGFFTSRRTGGKGGDDIYSFEKINPKLTIVGNVRDGVTLQPMKKLPVFLMCDLKDTISAITDEKGIFQFTNDRIKEENIYLLTVIKDNYFAKKTTIKIGKLKNDSTCYVNVDLQPIPEKPIVLPDIYYELDSWELQPQYQDTLMILVKMLNDNPKMEIELASHTDSRGSDQYNAELSQKRAETVVAFLAQKGIKIERLTAKGYGERVPRVLAKTISKNGYSFEQGTKLTESYIIKIEDPKKQEAAYQLNRRMEFSVIQKKLK